MINNSRPVEDPIRRAADLGTDLFCSNKRCNRVGKKNDFLNCGKCEKYFHPACADPPLVLRYANRFKWLCAECKVCQSCNQTSNEKLNRCSTCDRTFHSRCVTLTTSPMNGRSYCQDCLNCKNCLKSLPLLSIMNQNDFLSIKGHRVCDECWKYYKNVS